MKKIIAMLLALVMVFALCACGSQPAAEQTQAPAAEESKAPAEETPAAAEDTITVMVPPVTGTYLDDIDKWAAEFTEMYPNLHIEVIKTSWDDHNSKLSTMATSGEAPDIAEVSYSTIGSLVELGVGVEIADYMDADRLADYDQNAMDYMSIEGKAYGLPLYITIQSLGANREMLEAAGADVAKIQSEGWTYKEFLEILKAGTTSDCFGFVFANSGVTASDVPNIMGVMAGLTNAFTDDLKYAFTSDNMLNLLNAIEEMTKAGYMPNYGVEAGQRMVMCQQGKAMIFGKAMPLFENNINKNNAALEANDGTAVENSIALTYAFLPMPHMDGVQEACFGSVDGLVALRNNNTTDEHLKNVCLFSITSAPATVPRQLTPPCSSTPSASPAVTCMQTTLPKDLTRATSPAQPVRSASSSLLPPESPQSSPPTQRSSWTRSSCRSSSLCSLAKPPLRKSLTPSTRRLLSCSALTASSPVFSDLTDR